MYQKKIKISCDECRKDCEDLFDSEVIPLNWIKIESGDCREVKFHRKENRKIGEKAYVDGTLSGNIGGRIFCSKQCLSDFFENILKIF